MQWNVALDIGASGVRMAVRGRGLAFQESAAVATRGNDKKPFLFGNSALPLYGRASGRIKVGFPVDAGQVADEAILRAWTLRLIKEVSSLGLAHRPRVLIARSPEALSYTLKALVACCMEAGAAGCSLIRSDLMAAVGAGCDPMRPQGTLVGELGAGSMSVTLFSLGRVVESRKLPWGMRKADDAITTLLRNEYALEIGPQTAEELKLSLLSALGGTKLTVDVRGLDLNLSLPRTRSVEAEKLHAAVKPVIDDFCSLVQAVVRRVPTELAADLTDSPIALTGGGAALFGLDKMIAETTGLSVLLPGDPAGCVARGLAAAVETPAKYEAAAEAGATLLKS
jgi:rod shape-determining protein MreB